jgi:hypothetical protein
MPSRTVAATIADATLSAFDKNSTGTRPAKFRFRTKSLAERHALGQDRNTSTKVGNRKHEQIAVLAQSSHLQTRGGLSLDDRGGSFLDDHVQAPTIEVSRSYNGDGRQQLNCFARIFAR